jgi:hypothetical protein
MKKYTPVTIALMVISILAATASAQIEPKVETVEKVTGRGTLCGYLQDGARIKIMVESGSELNPATNGIKKSFKGKLQSCDDGFLAFWA